MNALESYFRRFGLAGPVIASQPQSDLRLAIVIPCFNEPDLQLTLESLWNCERPQCAVEVLVIINSSLEASAAVLAQNHETCRAAAAWAVDHHDPRLAFHMLQMPNLPPRHAGVGLARKIGMDEALRRLPLDGIISCLDSDCQCDPNYLCAIENHFTVHSKTPGASIYYEHPLSGPLPKEVYRAAAVYELHLRYYVQALRYASFPHAFHTVGSSMAVRAGVYLAQGGMNKRKAGEDFYFLHKVIALGGFTEINSTRVIPSPRESNRVPFGTGRAVGDQLRGQVRQTYPLEAFLDLKAFWSSLPELTGASSCMREFLRRRNVDQVLDEIRANTASGEAFLRRFIRWFDGFTAMKFVHFARDEYYGEKPVAEEASRLLALLGAVGVPDPLEVFRCLDRYGRLPNPPMPRNKGET